MNFTESFKHLVNHLISQYFVKIMGYKSTWRDDLFLGILGIREGRAFPLHFGLRGLEVVDGWHFQWHGKPQRPSKTPKALMKMDEDGCLWRIHWSQVNWLVDISYEVMNMNCDRKLAAERRWVTIQGLRIQPWSVMITARFAPEFGFGQSWALCGGLTAKFLQFFTIRNDRKVIVIIEDNKNSQDKMKDVLGICLKFIVLSRYFNFITPFSEWRMTHPFTAPWSLWCRHSKSMRLSTVQIPIAGGGREEGFGCVSKLYGPQHLATPNDPIGCTRICVLHTIIRNILLF